MAMVSDVFGNYNIIPRKLLRDKSVSDGTKLIYCILENLSHRTGYCYASDQFLSEEIGKSITTVSRAIRDLKEKGFISIEYTIVRGCEKKRLIFINYEVLNPDKDDALKEVSAEKEEDEEALPTIEELQKKRQESKTDDVISSKTEGTAEEKSANKKSQKTDIEGVSEEDSQTPIHDRQKRLSTIGKNDYPTIGKNDYRLKYKEKRIKRKDLKSICPNISAPLLNNNTITRDYFKEEDFLQHIYEALGLMREEDLMGLGRSDGEWEKLFAERCVVDDNIEAEISSWPKYFESTNEFDEIVVENLAGTHDKYKYAKGIIDRIYREKGGREEKLSLIKKLKYYEDNGTITENQKALLENLTMQVLAENEARKKNGEPLLTIPDAEHYLTKHG
jgi:DNA-binding Lrp family transcriptional regulator